MQFDDLIMAEARRKELLLAAEKERRITRFRQTIRKNRPASIRAFFIAFREAYQQALKQPETGQKTSGRVIKQGHC